MTDSLSIHGDIGMCTNPTVISTLPLVECRTNFTVYKCKKTQVFFTLDDGWKILHLLESAGL